MRVASLPAAACVRIAVNALPTIGAVPGMPNCYAVLGYGGNGITFAMAAAEILSAELCGERHPDGDLFAFDRGHTQKSS